MDVDAQFDLISRNLEEIINEEQIREILNRDGKLKVYWGTATTGKPHVGYLVPMFKISDFLKAGCEVTILLADLHAYLDNMKSDWKLLDKRVQYYEMILRLMLDIAGVDQSKLKFVRGTSFQLARDYTLDMYKMSALLTTSHTEKAGAEVVKQTHDPLMSSLLYPILQALDEEYLDVNVQFGGVDQRKIFMFARTHLPRIGYKPRSYLMNPLVPGLGKPVDGKPAKMSSSLPLSKLDFDDSNEKIKDKLKGAFSVDGVVENNGILALAKYVVFRICENQMRPFLVRRAQEHGGDISFDDYEALETAFTSGELASLDLKNAIAVEMIEVISAIRSQILGKYKDLYDEAYPIIKKGEVKRQTAVEASIHCLDIRVGKIISAEIHPSADSLYVEKIDVGESEPRTIVSGLRNYYTLEEFIGKEVLVICNIPPKKTRDVISNGMVYCVSSSDRSKVELLGVPEGSEVGDRVFCEGYEGKVEDNVKPKRYKRISNLLKTNESGIPTYDGTVWRTEKGELPATSIPNGTVA
jgi:tyrosyl-tRNA synthetase